MLYPNVFRAPPRRGSAVVRQPRSRDVSSMPRCGMARLDVFGIALRVVLRRLPGAVIAGPELARPTTLRRASAAMLSGAHALASGCTLEPNVMPGQPACKGLVHGLGKREFQRYIALLEWHNCQR